MGPLLLGPVAEIQNLSSSTLICHSLKYNREIPNNESIQEKIKNSKKWKVAKLKLLVIV